jgi:lipoprotein-anchoring transpeptidase ErfK/SrfK
VSGRLLRTAVAAAAITVAIAALASGAPLQRVTPHARPAILPAERLAVRVVRPPGVAVFDAPGGRRLGVLPMRTEWGSPRVMPVIRSEGPWLRVLADVAGRRSAWVLASGGALSPRPQRYALVASRSRGTLTVLDRGRVERTIRVAFGASASSTPVGRFAVTDRLSGAGYGGAYGCCILALNGHQPQLPPGWTGGDRLAIHATERRSLAPTAGCVVGTDADLRYLMRRAPLGTPVTIRP